MPGERIRRRPNSFGEAFDSVTMANGEEVIDVPSFKYRDFHSFLSNFRLPYRTVQEEEEGLPDLISFRVYGVHTYWWVILFANQIIDPFTELKAGAEIVVPPTNIIDTYRNNIRAGTRDQRRPSTRFN